LRLSIGTGRNRQRGLTLIECLVSIAILSFGLIAVSGALTGSLVSNKKASQIELATATAQDTIEEMRSLGFGSVIFSEFPASQAVPGLIGGIRTVEIEDSYQGHARLKHVVVIVSWRAQNGGTQRVRLETVIGNRANHTHG
jgi:prepilin-type N-terminal cleavage/methylation domain-containing protein